MPVTVAQVVELLEAFAPPQLAEEWDNVGLLWGDRKQTLTGILTCLTLTPEVAAEALQLGANLIVTHHPLPFRPLRQVTTDSNEGSILWQLARGGVSIYSPHTSFDSTRGGINERLASLLQLEELRPLLPAEGDTALAESDVGAGRWGRRPAGTTLGQLARELLPLLSIDYVQVVGSDDHPATRVAVACGSGSSLFDAARACGAEVVVTGEASFHALLGARAAGLGVLLVGHYASERFALQWLATWLAPQVEGVPVVASRAEQDPLRLVVSP